KLDYYLDGLEHDVERFPEDRAATNIKAIDGYLAEQAAEYLLAKGPDLSWVYFQYTDDVGHRVGDSPEMDAAVSFTDGLVGTLWAAIEARQKTLDEDWLIVVTTDHGRDALNGKGHGGQSERERSTWIATNSGCLADRFYATPAIVDIVPSILAHMHIQVPDTIRAALDGSSFLTC
ncbi:MAG: alkaline phosphatase family protein, partial [Gammaproteobacteria bacterium]|nr:alkaline phosphatase family protein [Gammaproteobacteria bacterium]